MTFDEFMATKLVGMLFSLFVLCATVWFAYTSGKTVGYQDGWKSGRADNPKPEVLVITDYVYDDKRIARFDPRVPDVFLLIDMKEKTIARIPVTQPELTKETVIDSEGKLVSKN